MNHRVAVLSIVTTVHPTTPPGALSRIRMSEDEQKVCGITLEGYGCGNDAFDARIKANRIARQMGKYSFDIKDCPEYTVIWATVWRDKLEFYFKGETLLYDGDEPLILLNNCKEATP